MAATIRTEVKALVDELVRDHSVTPGLAVVLVGQRTDSATYVRMKKRAAAECGFHSVDLDFEADVTQETLEAAIDGLNADDKVHGILVQLPLPKHIDEAEILARIDVAKDVDGFSAANIGNLCLRGGQPPLAVPCTPAGCAELLQRSGVAVSGKEVVVLGRSNIVGMPVAHLLQSMDATVTVCHSRTADLASHCRRADIVVAAIGRAELVQGDWLKPGAVVIDVGINSKPAPRHSVCSSARSRAPTYVRVEVTICHGHERASRACRRDWCAAARSRRHRARSSGRPRSLTTGCAPAAAAARRCCTTTMNASICRRSRRTR